MADTVQGPTVVIGGDATKANDAIDSVAKNMRTLTDLIRLTAASFVVREVFQFFDGIVRGSLEAIDATSKMARQLDSSVIGVQALQRAADLSGLSLGELQAAAKMLNGAIGELTTSGTGPAVTALQRLKLTVDDFKGLDADQKFGVLADAIKRASLSASEQQSIIRDLGIRQATMINLLEEGSEAFKNARKDVQDFSIALTNIEARQVEQANDAMTSFKAVIQGVGNQIAVVLAPILKGLGDSFGDAARGSTNFKDSIQSAMDEVIRIMGLVADSWAIARLRWTQLVDIVTGTGQAIVDGINAIKTTTEGWVESILGIQGHYKRLTEEAEASAVAIGKAAEKAAKDANDSMRQQLGGQFPSEALDAWVKKSREASQQVAADAVAADQATRDAAARTTAGLTLEAQKRLEEQQKAAQQSIDQLYKDLLTREDSENAAYTRRLEQLIAFHNQKLLTDEQFDLLTERNQQVHLERMYQAQAQAFAKTQQLYYGLAKGVDSLLGAIGQAIQSHGKKQFAITKAISIAQAVIKGYEAVVSSYAAGAAIGGPPVGAVYAAIAAATTAAQIAALAATNESSGSAAATAAGAAGSASAAAGPTQTLIVEGLNPNALMTGDVVASFAQKLLAYQADGGKVVIK